MYHHNHQPQRKHAKAGASVCDVPLVTCLPPSQSVSTATPPLAQGRPPKCMSVPLSSLLVPLASPQGARAAHKQHTPQTRCAATVVTDQAQRTTRVLTTVVLSWVSRKCLLPILGAPHPWHRLQRQGNALRHSTEWGSAPANPPRREEQGFRGFQGNLGAGSADAQAAFTPTERHQTLA